MVRVILAFSVLALAGCVTAAPDSGRVDGSGDTTGGELPQEDGPFVRRPMAGEPFCIETVDTRTGEIVEVLCASPAV